LAHAALAMAMPTGKTIGLEIKFSFVHNGFKPTENKKTAPKKCFPVPFCPRDKIFTRWQIVNKT
jgi:hypothetical protein